LALEKMSAAKQMQASCQTTSDAIKMILYQWFRSFQIKSPLTAKKLQCTISSHYSKVKLFVLGDYHFIKRVSRSVSFCCTDIEAPPLPSTFIPVQVDLYQYYPGGGGTVS
jgi:hypothetical protein